MYVPDPAAVLRTQAALLRPGGVVAPIEFDLHSAHSLPSTPPVAQALSWLREAFTRAGIDHALGPRLWAVLQGRGPGATPARGSNQRPQHPGPAPLGLSARSHAKEPDQLGRY